MTSSSKENKKHNELNLDKKVALIKEYCDPTTKVSYEALAKNTTLEKVVSVES